MSASLGLYRLQVVDSRLDVIHARLDEIRQILENDEEMRLAQKRVDETEKTHNSAVQVLKRAESEVSQQKIKIEQSESRLYSGTVKNPKELQDLQNEVAALKRHLMTLEDRQLEAMVEEESVTATKQKALDKQKAVQSQQTEQNQNLTTEKDELLKELERFESERQAALSPLEDNLLAVYDELRQQKRGIAVALVSEGACTACGTTLTPAQNQSVRSTIEINNCPSCKRILFANN